MQQQQRRFNPTAPPLDQRLIEEAQRLRKEARGTHPGIERERLIRRARQAETAARINEWLTLPGPAGTPVMPDYRAYTVDDDGHFNGYDPRVWANDGGHHQGHGSCAASPYRAVERTQADQFDTQATAQSRHPRDPPRPHVSQTCDVAGRNSVETK
jgi:hypothetical protein